MYFFIGFAVGGARAWKCGLVLKEVCTLVHGSNVKEARTYRASPYRCVHAHSQASQKKKKVGARTAPSTVRGLNISIRAHVRA